MFTIAYSAATGASVWLQHYTGAQFGGGASAVAVSPDGSTVYVTGGVMVSSGDEEYATVAYQAATGTMRWAQVQNGTSGSFGDDSAATALAVSPDGSAVFVTGLLTAPAGASYGTVAYGAAAGTKLWFQQYETPSATVLNDFAAALAVSPDGTQVFVTGAANDAYGTVAYAAATGAQQWVRAVPPRVLQQRQLRRGEPGRVHGVRHRHRRLSAQKLQGRDPRLQRGHRGHELAPALPR